MERYVTEDGTIAKYVHDDGSETSIKTWPKGMESCGGSGRNKFNVFASCSSGCMIKCGFCFLTSKRFPHTYLTYSEVVDNVSNAIYEEFKHRPELRKIPFNLSWMGMGEPWLDLDLIEIATDDILRNIAPLVDEIEGVDIATTLPSVSYLDSIFLTNINDMLIKTGKLTKKPEGRTNVRIFYSLHSLDDAVRKSIIPRTLDVAIAFQYLKKLSETYNIIYHYMFLEGINDRPIDYVLLCRYFSVSKSQLRILRFNQCPNTKFRESSSFSLITDKLKKFVFDVKIQSSPGSEVSAACGMFLMR